jgi:hypothetical protein
MGFLATLAGVADARLLELGRPGRGVILDVTQTGTMLESDDGVEETICIFILEVRRPGTPAYFATTRQRFPWHQLVELELGHTVVSVRIHPRHADVVVIDWDAPLMLEPLTVEPLTAG